MPLLDSGTQSQFRRDYMPDTLIHLTMNTGHARESARAEVAREIVEALLPIVKTGGGTLPVVTPYRVIVTREPGAAAFTLSHPEYGPVITGVLCTDAARAQETWATAEKLYLKIIDDLVQVGAALADSFMQLPPCPERVPWLAVIMTGAAEIIPGNLLQWAGDFEHCMAWAIIDAGRE